VQAVELLRRRVGARDLLPRPGRWNRMADSGRRADPVAARRLRAAAARDRARAALQLPGLALWLALLPLAAGAIVALAQTGHHLYPWGDHAVVETETLRTWRFDDLLGTYSRFQWHHPGPALFWFMSPLYMASGHSPAALNASAALLGAIAVAVVVAVTARRAGRTAAFLAAALAAFWIAVTGPVLVRDFWIPRTVALPFAALVVTTAAVATGTIELLPLAALIASFLAQTDLSAAPAALAVVVAGAVVFAALRSWR